MENSNVEEIGTGYIDEGSPVDFTNKYDFESKFSNEIINSAKYLGYDAMVARDQKRITIQDDKNFKMSVPVAKNHKVKLINETKKYMEQVQHREDEPMQKNKDEDKTEEAAQKDISSGSAHPILEEQEKNENNNLPIPVNNNKSDNSQNSINSYERYSIEEL